MSYGGNDVKTVRILWKVTGYPVHWVEELDEVPLWDTSRGFSLTAGANCFTPRTFSPPYELKDLQRMDKSDYNSGLMPAKMEEWQPSPAPKVSYPRLVRTDCENIELGEYRQDDDVLSELACLADETYLGPWRQGKPAKVLKRKVAELAEKYGPPYSLEQNTLFAWLSLIQHVDIHLRAIENLNRGDTRELFSYLNDRRMETKARIEGNTLQIARDPSHPFLYRFPLYYRSTEDGFEDESELTKSQESEWAKLQACELTESQYNELVWLRARQWVELQESLLTKEQREISHDLDNILPDNGEPFEPSLDELELIELGFLLDMLDEFRNKNKDGNKEDKFDENAFKQMTAKMLFSNLNLSIFDQKGPDPGLTLTHKGFVLRCPLGVWVDYRLAEAWRDGLLLQVCEHCSTVFLSGHKRRKYCKSGTCKQAQSNKNRKEKAGASTRT